MRLPLSCTVLLTLPLLAPSPAAAQCSEPVIAASIGNKDHFGESLSMDGARAVIGAPGANGTGIADGAAFVFERAGRQWIQVQKLAVPEVGYVEGFASSIDIDGDVIVGGAPYDSGALPLTGGAWVFERVGSTWTLFQSLIPGTLDQGDQLGWSVAVEGQRILVGSRSHVNANGSQGTVWVFERGPTAWQEVQELSAPPGTSGMGAALAQSGDTILAGTTSGRAVVFERSAGVWVQTAVLVAPMGAYARFGYSVALQGDRALIGAPEYSTPGAAFVFERLGGGWIPRARLEARDGTYYTAQFGFSVALDGARALVGAPFRHLDGLSDMGTAYMFQLRAGTWTHSFQFVDPSPTGDHSNFGWAVGVQGPAMLIGIPRDHFTSNDSGSAEAFTLPDSAFTTCFCFGDTPCSNPRPMSGCRNSTGAGVLLSPCGTDSASSDDLVFSAADLPPFQAALLFAGTSEIGLDFGDGRLCVGGQVVRVETRSADSAGSVSYGPGLAASAGFLPGQVRHFQLWYRDPQGPCASGFNTSSGLALRYGP